MNERQKLIPSDKRFTVRSRGEGRTVNRCFARFEDALSEMEDQLTFGREVSLWDRYNLVFLGDSENYTTSADRYGQKAFDRAASSVGEEEGCKACGKPAEPQTGGLCGFCAEQDEEY